MSTTDKKTIEYHLKGLWNIRVGSPIRKWFFTEIIGWNLYANCTMRKDITMAELQEEIDAIGLPLEIKDPYRYTNSFQVYLKDVI